MLSKREISIINSRIDLLCRYYDKTHEKMLSARSDDDKLSLFLESFMYKASAGALSVMLEELLEKRGRVKC